jgi:hypothetical protein
MDCHGLPWTTLRRQHLEATPKLGPCKAVPREAANGLVTRRSQRNKIKVDQTDSQQVRLR